MTHIVNPEQSNFRYTFVKAIHKDLFNKKSTHWALVVEHAAYHVCITNKGLHNFDAWSKGKTLQLVFQAEEKNQQRLWQIQHLLLFFASRIPNNEQLLYLLMATVISKVKRLPVEESHGVRSDDRLLALLTAQIPVLQPYEMIHWERIIKDSAKKTEV